MNIYFISGLGADKSAFQKTVIPEYYNVIHLEWIIPHKKETLIDYALRLARDIDKTKPFVLIGLSFGGIIVSELSQILHPVKSILISSASTRQEIPWYFKLAGTLKIHKIIPTAIFRSKNIFTFWAFGAKTKEEKDILCQILDNIDNRYMKWAIHTIFTWKNKVRSEKIFHLHGTKDFVLPIRFVKPDIKISGGRHFMVLSMHEEVNKILNEELKKIL